MRANLREDHLTGLVSLTNVYWMERYSHDDNKPPAPLIRNLRLSALPVDNLMKHTLVAPIPMAVAVQNPTTA
jgi:hypothetical protein